MKNSILLLFAALFNCSNCYSEIKYGIYSDSSSVSLVLFEDSTFYYSSRRDITNYQYSFGKWEKKDKQIILNSIIKDNFHPVKIDILKSNNYHDSIVVNIQLSSKNMLGYVDKDYYTTPYTNDSISLLPQKDIPDLPIEDIVNMQWNVKERGSFELFIDHTINNISFDICRHSELDFLDISKSGQEVKTNRIEINTQLGDSIVVQIDVNPLLWGHRIFDNEIVKIEDNYLVFRELFHYDENSLSINEVRINNKAGIIDIMTELYWDEKVNKYDLKNYTMEYQECIELVQRKK